MEDINWRNKSLTPPPTISLFSENLLAESIDRTISAIKNFDHQPLKIVSKTLNGSPYHMYLMYIEHSNYSESFNKTAQFLMYQFDKKEMSRLIEKNTIRWVSMDTILNCIENKEKNTPISLRGVFYTTLVNSRDQLQFLIK
jgi:hypothetical protein